MFVPGYPTAPKPKAAKSLKLKGFSGCQAEGCEETRLRWEPTPLFPTPLAEVGRAETDCQVTGRWEEASVQPGGPWPLGGP